MSAQTVREVIDIPPTYPNLAPLYTVVLPALIRGRSGAVSFTPTVVDAAPDRNGYQMVKVTIALSGKSKDVDSVISMVRRVKEEKVEVAPPGQFVPPQLIQEAPVAIGCVIAHVKRTNTFMGTTLVFPEDRARSFNELYQKIANYLSYHQPQRFREAAAVETHRAASGDDAFFEEISSLPPSQAKERLKRFAASLPTRCQGAEEILKVHHAALEIEKAYCAAVLGEYEIHDTLLETSADLRDIVKVRIRLEDGQQPFTERRPSVLPGDNVLLYPYGKNEMKYRAFFVEPTAVWVHADDRLLSYVRNRARFDVLFDCQAYKTRCGTLQRASTPKGLATLNFLLGEDGAMKYQDIHDVELTWPRHHGTLRAERGRGVPSGQHFSNDETELDLPEDEEQRFAINLCVKRPDTLRKVLIRGPPGTGKTETMCRAAVNILKTSPSSRILFLAPSNSACDVAAMRLLNFLEWPLPEARVLMRFYKKSRHPLTCPPTLFPYANFSGNKPFSDLIYADEFNEGFDGGYHTIVVAAASATHRLVGPFSHIFFDEVQQASLCEAVVGLSHFVASDHPPQLIVFGGDDHQIHPSCLAPFLKPWLCESTLHFVTDSTPKIHLESSYRSCASLVDLQSLLFYDGKLQPASPTTEEGAQLSRLEVNRGQSQGMRFIHCEAVEEQEKRTSYRNVGEAEIVWNCALSLHLDNFLSADQIVVFTQYKEQRRYIQQGLQIRGMKETSVRELKEFLGDEKDIVIISLVRNEVDDAFLSEEELNTAMSRAKRLCIIVGNGKLAETQPKWRQLLEELKKKKAVDGYDYDKRVFDGRLWQPLAIKAPLKVRAFIPKQERWATFQRLSKEEVLNNGSLFVGQVVTNAWEENRFVKNRFCSGFDALIETQTSTGERNDWVFPGDIVAIRLADVLRWKRTARPNLRIQKNAELSDPRPILTSLPADDMTIVDEFADVAPEELRDNEGKSIRPVGTVVSILHKAVLPDIFGNHR